MVACDRITNSNCWTRLDFLTVDQDYSWGIKGFNKTPFYGVKLLELSGTWEDPPTCIMGTFFLMSLTLTEPSLNNFQLNGAKLF